MEFYWVRYGVAVFVWVLMGIRFKRVRWSIILFAPILAVLCELSLAICLMAWHDETFNEREIERWERGEF